MAKRDIQLKILNGKNDTVEKYDLTGFEDMVPEFRKIDEEMEKLNSKREELRGMIMDRVRAIKQEEEERGILYKTFLVASSDGVPATVMFKNVFSKLDVENETIMRKVLGNTFSELFKKDKSMSLKKSASLDALREALGDKADVFFETKEFIAFEKDFMEKRAALRKELKPAVNAQLDKWATDSQAKPDLRLKG